MENFDISVKRFDEFAREYALKFMNVESYTDSLIPFCKFIGKENPHILELACGPGNVTHFLKQQLPESTIIGVDLAPRMIEIAKELLPDVEFMIMDIRRIADFSQKFDAIICSFGLPYLSKTDAANLVANSSAHLNSGGVLYISTMEGNESRAGIETTSFSGEAEFYINYHLQSDLRNSFEENGLEIVHLILQDYIEADGSITTDMIFIGIKR